MLDAISYHPEFDGLYQSICRVLGFDPMARIKSGDVDLINSNSVSSLLTILSSAIALNELKKGGYKLGSVAGYSVGQWTAIFAAGAISFETLIEVVNLRATLMDQCFVDEPGGMLGVIGIDPVILENYCIKMREQNLSIYVSNYNCYGQYSLSGTLSAINIAITNLKELKPKRIVRLPTSGAWHCPLLNIAADKFRSQLMSADIGRFKARVINNVNGQFLPEKREDLLDCLAQQVSHPVQWELGIKNLISTGYSSFIEVGYGNMLTKFGFFIDRVSALHTAYYPNRGSA